MKNLENSNFIDNYSEAEIEELTQYAILLLDDELEIRETFKDELQDTFRIFTAANVKEAEAIMEEYHKEIGLIIADYRLNDEITGLDILMEFSTKYPGIIRILATAYSDIDLAIEAVNSNVIYKYMKKPWEDELEIGIFLDALDTYISGKKQTENIVDQVRSSEKSHYIEGLFKGLSFIAKNADSALKSLFEAINRIFVSEEQLSYLIEEIKEDFTNKQSEKEFSITDLIEKEKKNLEEQGTKINIEIDRDYPKFKTESPEILKKLFSESIKYTARNEPEITIKCGVLADNARARISFSPFVKPENGKDFKSLSLIFLYAYHLGGSIWDERDSIYLFLPFKSRK